MNKYPIFLHLLSLFLFASLFLTGPFLHAANYFNSTTNDHEVAIGDNLLELFTTPEEEETPPYELSIVENITKNEDLSTLLKALQTADLVNVLKGNGPFTLFAPTNEAFEQLPPGTLQNLLKPENKSKLAGILTYHITPGKKTPVMLNSGKIKTLNGKELDVRSDGKQISINNAKVIQPEITSLNGIIYIVDTVILPN